MARRLAQNTLDALAKSRDAAVAAVAAYNRPGPRFRTAEYIVLITIAWTSLFHAIFYDRRRRPWYRRRTPGGGIRYEKIDGEPKHWDLSECLRQFYGGQNPPERKNLEFLVSLRNKIEHRNLPALDPALFGECQAALLNLEEHLVQHFGRRYALADQLAVSLQMTKMIPEQKARAARELASDSARNVREFIERFRAGLPAPVLNSMKYSFSVFLVPRVANREKAATVAVEFIPIDEASDADLERMEKLNVLIREKHIPIANLDLLKPGEVVHELAARLPHRISIWTHTRAWKYFAVRPSSGDQHPERTIPEYCVYDQAHNDYLYTPAWVEKLARELVDVNQFERVVGKPPDAR